MCCVVPFNWRVLFAVKHTQCTLKVVYNIIRTCWQLLFVINGALWLSPTPQKRDFECNTLIHALTPIYIEQFRAHRCTCSTPHNTIVANYRRARWRCGSLLHALVLRVQFSIGCVRPSKLHPDTIITCMFMSAAAAAAARSLIAWRLIGKWCVLKMHIALFASKGENETHMR